MRRILPVSLDAALLVLRIALAAVLLYHGIPKLLDFNATVGMFQQMAVPAPALSAGFAMLVEVVGGVLILLGIAVDVAGLLVVVNMLGAIVTVHWKNGFDFMKSGWEHPFTVLCLAVAVALAGAGAYALGHKRTA